MASTIYLTLGERTIMVSRPATYQDLVSEIRVHFPNVSAVYSLVVLFQPANINGGLLQNWVQVEPSAYSAVHDGAELFVNVVHPLTKEYILPLPGQSVPNRQHRKQVRRTDGLGNRVGNESGDYDATAQDDQVSKTRPRGVSSGPGGVSNILNDSLLSLELERPGGDAFARGWGGASGRLRRSSKLVPNLKDCKEAVGLAVGQSHFYPDDEEEQIADIELGMYQGQQQNQPPQATEAGWYAGTEINQSNENQAYSEAQHLAGGLEDQNEGKKATHFYSNDANRNWFAISHSPRGFPETLPRSHRGTPLSMSPRWGNFETTGRAWGGYRTPSPRGWNLRQGGHNVPEYVQRSPYSPTYSGAWNQGGNPGGWGDVADQEYSRIVAGPDDHAEVGHLTNGASTNGAHTNGVTTNGNLTNGHPAAHSEVSQYPQHQYQHYGSSDWSPLRRQSPGYYQPQGPRTQGYTTGDPGLLKAFAASRPRRDPAEVTYGSPLPRFQGSNSGWTTIGRKKKPCANIPVQEESDPDLAQPNDDNNNPWYAQPPPFNDLHGTTGHGRGWNHWSGRPVRDHTDNAEQKQRPEPEMNWGSDFWGGPPPNRAQRVALGHNDTPASRHWQ